MQRASRGGPLAENLQQQRATEARDLGTNERHADGVVRRLV